MSKHLFYAFLLLSATRASGQTADTGTFIVHRHLKIIGKETYQIKPGPGGSKLYQVNCFYSDRGTNVPLATTLLLSAWGDPLKLTSVGSTSRTSKINDTVMIDGDKLVIKKPAGTTSVPKTPNMFPVDGYAPATVQGLLANWWQKKGRPASISGAYGPITVSDFGTDTLKRPGGDKILRALGIKNVIWGWEFLWLDDQGQLAALATINAEGDKIEFIRPDYEDQLLFFAGRSAAYGTRQYPAKPTKDLRSAIVHGVLVDLEKGTELPDAAILIDHGKISWTGPTNKAVIPKGTIIVDAKGKRMLPGLWDMHAHLKQVEWGPAYMANGITTVRDMANEFVFINTMKSNIDAGKGVGPNILRAGIIDGPGPAGNGIMIAETKEQGVALVQKYKAAGFDQVKLYGQLAADVVQAVCDEAHRQGLTVAGHIPKSITTMQGVEMGMNMISHISYVIKAFKTDTNFMVDLNDPGNKKIMQELLDKKIVVDPTLAIYELIFRPLDRPLTEIEPAFNTLPEKVQDDWISTGLPPADAKKRAIMLKGWQHLVYQLNKAGVPIVAGTDMCIPGYTLYRELELYVATGFTPLQALRSAMITPAGVMGLSAKKGNLAKGKDADIILVDGDPLKNISDIRKVKLVIKAGQRYDPDELHHSIGFDLQQPVK